MYVAEGLFLEKFSNFCSADKSGWSSISQSLDPLGWDTCEEWQEISACGGIGVSSLTISLNSLVWSSVELDADHQAAKCSGLSHSLHSASESSSTLLSFNSLLYFEGGFPEPPSLRSP